MTDNKRFYKQKSTIEDYMICDDDKEDAYFISCKDESNVDYLVVLLNKLNDENKELKQDIENLKITIEARETLIDVCEKKFNELGFIITVDDDGYVIE